MVDSNPTVGAVGHHGKTEKKMGTDLFEKMGTLLEDGDVHK